jgi:hypothetical protein
MYAHKEPGLVWYVARTLQYSFFFEKALEMVLISPLVDHLLPLVAHFLALVLVLVGLLCRY